MKGPRVNGDLSPIWLVCGSGPSARRGMIEALEEFHPQITITCNGGHRLFDARTGLDAPTFYFITDMKACEMYAADSVYLQRRYDTMVMTLARNASGQAARGLSHADQFVTLDRAAPAGEHTPGKIAGHPLSGLYMLDIALNRGARTVLIVGFDGYASGPEGAVVDYFDGRHGKVGGASHNLITERYLETAVERRPDVRFVVYGSPRYRVPGRVEMREAVPA